jgi:hypothetical protein
MFFLSALKSDLIAEVRRTFPLTLLLVVYNEVVTDANEHSQDLALIVLKEDL